MKVRDLTLEELKTLIRETVTEILEEYFDDPDSGLQVKEDVKQRLVESKKRTEAGEKGIPFEQIVKKLGLKGQ